MNMARSIHAARSRHDCWHEEFLLKPILGHSVGLVYLLYLAVS
jgi:hypothetical protein